MSAQQAEQATPLDGSAEVVPSPFPCPVCGNPLERQPCEKCAAVAYEHLGPAKKASPRETVQVKQRRALPAAGAGATAAYTVTYRRWARMPPLGIRRFLPAGPRFLRCGVCSARLTKKKRLCLPVPSLVLCSSALRPREAGVIICSKHTYYPGRACRACGLLAYAAGPGFDRGGLTGEVLVNREGAELAKLGAAYECPFCWSLFPVAAAPLLLEAP